ncbi:hypothetical protein BT69DRAFT_1279636 [Atractiella rhizophila]|nr:hypothetical protein BT69DRAFT_1279636 [Atractiella rhizophila]
MKFGAAILVILLPERQSATSSSMHHFGRPLLIVRLKSFLSFSLTRPVEFKLSEYRRDFLWNKTAMTPISSSSTKSPFRRYNTRKIVPTTDVFLSSVPVPAASPSK